MSETCLKVEVITGIARRRRFTTEQSSRSSTKRCNEAGRSAILPVAMNSPRGLPMETTDERRGQGGCTGGFSTRFQPPQHRVRASTGCDVQPSGVATIKPASDTHRSNPSAETGKSRPSLRVSSFDEAMRFADQLGKVAVKAPLQALFAPFLLGIWVRRRQSSRFSQISLVPTIAKR